MTIHLGELLAERRDAVGRGRHARAHFVGELGQPLVHRLETRHEIARLAEQRLTRRGRRRVVADVLQRIREPLQRSGQARLGPGEQVVERFSERDERLGAVEAARRRAQLVCKNLIAETPRRRNVDAGAEVSLTQALGLALRQLDALTAVAGRARVRDVVRRRRQCALLREQRGKTDVQQVRHEGSLRSSQGVGSGKSTPRIALSRRSP